MKQLSALVLMIAVGAVQAQSVWRCGADGRSFSDVPCREGQTVELSESRPAADLASARQQAARDKVLAAQLVRERQAAEMLQTAGAAGIRGSRLTTGKETLSRKPPAFSRSQPRPEAAGIWRATAPASRRMKD